MTPALERALILTRVVMLDGHYAADSCIAATRLALDIAAIAGVPGRPLKVVTAIYNRVLWDALRAGVDKPLDVPGAWSVGIGAPGTPKRPNGYMGHVVALLGNDLVDLSIDQASRPQHDLRIDEPLIMPLDPDALARFLAGEIIAIGTKWGWTARYEAHPDDRSFESSPDWQDGRKPIRDGIIATVAQRLKEPA